MTPRGLISLLMVLCLSACATTTPEATPEPSATSSRLTTAVVSSADLLNLTTADGSALPETEPSAINCAVDGTRAGRWTATFLDGTKATVGVTIPASELRQAVWQRVEFGHGWVMAVVPGDVRDLDVVTDVPNETGHDYAVAAGYLDAIDSTCLAIRYDAAADAALVRGLIWRVVGSSTFVKDTGETVLSMDLSANEEQVSVYRDPELDVFGIITASGYEASYHPSKSKDPFGCLLFSTSQQPDGRWRTFFAGVVPAGSTDVRMRFLSGAANPSLQTVTAASGEVFFLAAATTARQSGELFDTMSYADAAGKRVTPTWRTG